MLAMTKRALLSVYDKTGIVDFARFLLGKGFSLLSTGGTYKELMAADVDVMAISEYTGEAEILGGRVKTLHPKIHGGLLGRRDSDEHRDVMVSKGINPIDVVVVNLYPFIEKFAARIPTEELVDFIDIGGQTMIRAAAKNHAHVLVVSDPADYPLIMAEWEENGSVSLSTRRRMASKVFALTAAYDSVIAGSLQDGVYTPERFTAVYKKEADLRYGENPHQRAAWYLPTGSKGALSDLTQHQGKPLSFNNIRDLDAAWRVVNEFHDLACVGVKHSSPCAVSLGASVLDAWQRVRDADPLSIFGAIAAFNREVDEEAAHALKDIFLEIIAAPDFTQNALKILKKKKNLRVITLHRRPSDYWEALPVDGGICLQELDREFAPESAWTIPTRASLTDKQKDDLSFAWKVVKHVKSNGIVLAMNSRTLGIGSGQPNRVGAVQLALGVRDVAGAVLASDAFFPFDDAVKTAARAGIAAIIQPGGSLRDKDSIKACDEAGIAMVLTGRRHFRH